MQGMKRSLSIVALLALAAAPALARRNVTAFHLEWRPQQAVAASDVVITPVMRERAVALSISDGRPGDRATVVGSRTNDDDQIVELTATNPVVPYVEGVARQQLERWGVVVRDGADLVLAGKLVNFEVVETNQAVGATFNAKAQFSFDLQNRGGGVLWSGTGSGDATRYGKKFSNENCNEVLSDALLEALADAISNPGLHSAWGGGTPAAPAASATAPTGAAISPAALLLEVRKLMDQGLEQATIVDYVERQTLSAALSSSDVVAWKESGVPEEVVRVALSLPVR